MESESMRWFSEPHQKCVILTYGYSRTVREAILEYQSPSSSSDERRARVPTDSDAMVFVLQDPHDSRREDAREMVFEVRERLRGRKINIEVTCGDEMSLGRFLRGSDCKIVCILGAELWDINGQIVHANRGRRRLRRIRDMLSRMKAVCVVVAEEYKSAKVQSQAEGTVETHIKWVFSKLDRVDVYEYGLVNYVVSEKGPHLIHKAPCD